MNSFYTEEELHSIGFKAVGHHVYISKKCSIYSPEQMEIGNYVRIDDFCILSGKIILHNYIHIAAYSALYGGNKGICIDDFANLSSRTTVYARNDDYSGMSLSNPMIPNQYKQVIEDKVCIKKHVLIGSGCVILPGVTLHEGCVLGAMSFLKTDVEAWSIYAGVPAVYKKKRKNHLLQLEKQFLESVGNYEK